MLNSRIITKEFISKTILCHARKFLSGIHVFINIGFLPKTPDRNIQGQACRNDNKRICLVTYRLISILCLLSLTACAPLLKTAGEAGKEPVVIYTFNADYEEVWDGLKMALDGRGLAVSSVSHVGEMLERTGKDLGRTKKIYGEARVLEFCSAVISRDMMEKNPHFLPFCPYQIMVYTLPEDEKKVYLSYRRLIWKDDSGKDVLEPVEKLNEELIKEVIEMYGK